MPVNTHHHLPPVPEDVDNVQNPHSSPVLSKRVKIKTYGTIILPAVLFGCETWLVSLTKERRLRAFENWNRVVREILGIGW